MNSASGEFVLTVTEVTRADSYCLMLGNSQLRIYTKSIDVSGLWPNQSVIPLSMKKKVIFDNLLIIGNRYLIIRNQKNFKRFI
jgi:hypothetical protein